MRFSQKEVHELESLYCTFVIAFHRNRLRDEQKKKQEKSERYKYHERQVRSLWHIKYIVRQRVISRERIRELNQEIRDALRAMRHPQAQTEAAK